MNIHLNWTATGDWTETRSKLLFLKTTLYGNFADVSSQDFEVEDLKNNLEKKGFKVSVEPYFNGKTLLRLS